MNKCLLGMLAAVGVAAPVFSAPYPFRDDFEAGLPAWTSSGIWTTAVETARSPVHVAVDSAGGYYTNTADAWLALASGVDLSAATRPALAFFHRFDFEEDYDHGRVEVSTNAGATWSALPQALYTGRRGALAREQLDLAAFGGRSDVRVRFRVTSDASVTRDGWSVDDVRIAEAPASPALAAGAVAANSIALNWSAAPAPGFARYVVLRSLTAGFDWHTAAVMAEIGDPATTSWTDIAVGPKTAYRYRVLVIDSNDLHGISAELGVTTVAGMDYPFVDNGEGGGAIWSPDAPWALVAEAACSPTNGWSDSPGTNYANNANVALTLSAPVNLSVAQLPALCFVHRHDFAAGDLGLVECSTNAGNAWQILRTFTGTTSGWSRVRVDLSSHAGAPQFLIRFRLTSDSAGTGDGWRIDDISLSETAPPIFPPVASEVGPHSVRLTWTATTATAFSRYEVHRATNDFAGVLLDPAGAITDRLVSSVVVTGLVYDAPYFFRMHAVNPWGGWSADAPTTTTVRTPVHTLPFADDFENGPLQWMAEGQWGTGATNAHGGARALSDSHADYIDNTNASVMTAVNLTGSAWPVLRFWDTYRFAAGDYGYLEVSPNGSGWTTVYGASGAQTNWTAREVDLSEWKNAPNLRIRYRVQADASGTDDGWRIDDVAVVDRGNTARSLPFVESFESGLTNWVGDWGAAATGAFTGTLALDDGLDTPITPSTGRRLAVGTFSLAGTTNPQCAFWWKGNLNGMADFRLNVSTDGGVSWTDLWGAGGGAVTTGWTRVQVPLLNQRGSANVRLRFYLNTYCAWWGCPAVQPDVQVDGLVVTEAVEQPGMVGTVPHLKSMDVSWRASGLGAAFKQYRLYRSTDGTVDASDVLVGVYSATNQTSMVDSNLSIGAMYWYGIYVVDTNEVWWLSTNVVSGTTVPVTLPLTDSMESLAQWDATGTWGVDTNSAHGGAACLSDSPSGNYGDSRDTEIRTAVNLTGSVWPVLRFWDAFRMAAGDYGYLEVSPNGSGWTTVYGASGAQTNWTAREVDLSEWKNVPNLRIRYRVTTDASGTDDGWRIDDVAVVDRGTVARSLPFIEGFESGLTNWVGDWGVATSNAFTGTLALDEGMDSPITPSTGRRLAVGTFSLAGTTNPQCAFWWKGNLNGAADFRLHVSTDGGVSWTDLWGAGGGAVTTGWTRVQVPLLNQRGSANVRLRFYLNTFCPWWGCPAVQPDVQVDGLVVTDAVEQPGMVGTVPHLKSMDVSWRASGLGAAFKQYRVYRSTDGTVDASDVLVGVYSATNQTTATDAGLSIGATYWYGIYVVDTNDVWWLSTNVVSGTTVPVTFPLIDSMETLAQWDATGSWGVDTNSAHGGTACLSDSPSGNYGDSRDTEIRTAVNLTGSVWPVLRFWETYRMAANDYGLLQVSPDGGGWTTVYGASGAQTNWTAREVDLSEWKNAPNLRIRYRVTTDASGTDDGWRIDDVAVVDRGTVARSLPFIEGFESGLTNWVGDWGVATSNAFTGTLALDEGMDSPITPSTGRRLAVGTFSLAGTTNPQCAFWWKGNLNGAADFRLHVSTDGGMSWTDLWGAGGGAVTTGWTRVQVSLLNQRGSANVRLRFYLNTYCPWWGCPAVQPDVQVDGLVVTDAAEQPAMIGTVPHLKTMDVNWRVSGLGAAFKQYRLYRSTDGTVDASDVLVGVYSATNQTTATDTGLSIGAMYWYGIYVVDTNEVWWLSTNVVSGTTVPVTLPLTDSMESLAQWDATGSWGVETNDYASGPACLADSPGVGYANNLNAEIRTAVNLTGSIWPVLRFRDAGRFAANDYGYVEVSPNGSSWTTLGGLAGVQSEWTWHEIDLSEWKTVPNLRIRFRSTSDGDSGDTGWMIDDVSVVDRGAPALPFPYLDTFEVGMTNWVGDWGAVTSGLSWAGTNSMQDGIATLTPSTSRRLAVGPFDLRAATNPTCVFWYRGDLGAAANLQLHVSSDNGLTWVSIWETGGGWVSNAWTRAQLPLSAYRQENVRLRFVCYSYCLWWGCPAVQPSFFVDNFGVGDGPPGAPGLATPADLANVTDLRPALVVWNAMDAESDALTYRFEVFDDAGLTNLVASVPAVASGEVQTQWKVDQNLPNSRQYWWRCRAADASNTGPWMTTATFFINQTNNAPTQVLLAGPPRGSVLRHAGFKVFWYPSTDVDAGDGVVRYHVQIDDDPNFASPEVNDPDVVAGALSPTGGTWALVRSLSELSGWQNLGMITDYYWRVRAQDTRDDYSPWSSGVNWFTYGIPAPNVSQITRGTNGTWTLSWDVGVENVYIHFTPVLHPADWRAVAGPLPSAGYWTVNPTNGVPAGFFRVSGE